MNAGKGEVHEEALDCADSGLCGGARDGESLALG